MRRTSAAVIKESQERIGAAGGQHIGDLATWNADRVDVRRDKVREVFEREGLKIKSLATDLEPGSALMRAAGEIGKVPGLMVRPFARPLKDSPTAIGIYVEEPHAGETGDGYTCGARVRINAQGQAIALAPENASPLEEAITQAEEIAKRANHLMGHAKTVDISAALISAVKTLGGIPLRDRGGFYLIPVSSCVAWRRLSDAVEPFGIEQVRIEMHDAPSNMKAVAGAAKGSLEEEIRKLKEDLEKVQEEGMRKSAIDRRVHACDALIAKAELYRNVLQDTATAIEEKVMKLKVSFAKELDKAESAPVALDKAVGS